MGTSLAASHHPHELPHREKTFKEQQDDIETKVKELLAVMTLREKIGQLSQRQIDHKNPLSEEFKETLRSGQVGSVLNPYHLEEINGMQQVIMNESRLKIPLIVGKDIIHGFRTILPIPLGMAASFNPALVTAGSRMAAVEGTTIGARWTFSPMMDIARDPRWGRIAEGFGEDPYLAGQMAKAAVAGFQGNDLKDITAVAACAKHYAAYGAAEGGWDFNIALVPENTLRDVYLVPFMEAALNKCQTFMTGYHSLNGIPTSANEFLTKKVLREDWKFDGFVVSDYNAVEHLVNHYYANNPKDAAVKGFNSGVDMEMVSTCYLDNMEQLIKEGLVKMEDLDRSVSNILRIKFRLDIFTNWYTDPARQEILLAPAHLEIAKKTALESAVLLQNKNKTLPLSKTIKSLAVIGPLADDGTSQLGCWAPDGRGTDTHTPLTSLKALLTKTTFHVAKGFENCNASNTKLYSEAITAAKNSEIVLMFLGEDNNMSGEGHSRSNIHLPGLQVDLITQISKLGKPIVLLLYAGRSLLLKEVLPLVDSILYVWQLGTMSGPAITDLLFGVQSPSGKLPITFLREKGQIPMYYNKKNTGRPNDTHSYQPFTSSYVDIDSTHLFPFGYGLSYTTFTYSNLSVSKKAIAFGQTLIASALVRNTGTVIGAETSLLFIRDLVGSYTRPVRELKGFSKNVIKPGDGYIVTFIVSSEDLKFWTKDNEWKAEPGKFSLWIGPNADQGLTADFELLPQQYNSKEEFEELK